MQMNQKRRHSMPGSQGSCADVTVVNAADANDSDEPTVYLNYDEPTVYLNFDGPVNDSANEAIS